MSKNANLGIPGHDKCADSGRQYFCDDSCSCKFHTTMSMSNLYRCHLLTNEKLTAETLS